VNTPSIIAYRNPLEQWLWESGVAPVVLVLIVVLPLLLAAALTAATWIGGWKRKRRR
jgi:hypothetical protein